MRVIARASPTEIACRDCGHATVEVCCAGCVLDGVALALASRLPRARSLQRDAPPTRSRAPLRSTRSRRAGRSSASAGGRRDRQLGSRTGAATTSSASRRSPRSTQQRWRRSGSRVVLRHTGVGARPRGDAAVVDGVMFVSLPGACGALDARTGAVLCGTPRCVARLGEERLLRRGEPWRPASTRGASTRHARRRLVALDAGSGAKLWEVNRSIATSPTRSRARRAW